MRTLGFVVSHRPPNTYMPLIYQVLRTCEESHVLVLNSGRDPHEFETPDFDNERLFVKHCPVNVGHPIGLNFGIVTALSSQYEFFAKFDDDLRLLSEDWYAKCLELMGLDRQIAVIGGKQLKPDEKTVQAAYMHFFPNKLDMSAGQPRHKDVLDRTLRVSIAPNAFFFARVEYLKEIGYYDILFTPSQYDDVDYCFRTWMKGYSCVYDGRIEMVHAMQETPDDPQRRLVSLAHAYALGLKYKGFMAFGNKLEGEIDQLGRELVLPKLAGPASKPPGGGA